MKGEDIVDDTVWIVKTHSPWVMIYAPKFKAQKVMCVLRNPLDVIVSWMNLVHTGVHNLKISYEVEKDYPVWFQFYIEKVVGEMK